MHSLNALLKVLLTKLGLITNSTLVILNSIQEQRLGVTLNASTQNKQHKWQVENRQGEGKNSIGNIEVKELICTTHGHELKGGMWVGGGVQGRGE